MTVRPAFLELPSTQALLSKGSLVLYKNNREVVAPLAQAPAPVLAVPPAPEPEVAPEPALAEAGVASEETGEPESIIARRRGRPARQPD